MNDLDRIENDFSDNLVCKLLGIKYPIIQGGMAWVADAYLAAAVSNGGGLGVIAAMNSNPNQVKEQIQLAKKLTDKPFGVNIMLLSPFRDEIAKLVIDEGVKVVTTGAGNPSKYVKEWLKAEIIVAPVVPSVGYARLMQRVGASMVIAEGTEAGGHIGELTTMALVPQVCDAVEIPVVAAGGIADGRGMAAVFMLGAAAVQCGTCFLACKEANVHQVFKDKVIAASDIDTVVTGKRFGHPVRSLKTKFTKQYVDFENMDSTTLEELELLGAGALRLAVKEGDLEKGCFMAGQVAGLIKEELSAAQIMQNMLTLADKTINSLKFSKNI